MKTFKEHITEGKMKELHGYIEDGLSAKEIAKIMKLDVKTIKKLMDENVVVESAKDNDGKALKVGDVVLFKSDVEQYGKITKISGSTLTVKPDGMKGGKFIGDYIGGDKVTTVDAPDVWKESVEIVESGMSDKQLATLKKEYAKVDKINPTTPAYKKMKKKLESLPDEVLQQIVDAEVKFLRVDAASILKGRKK
jgi:hypothetical protein